MAIIVLLCPSWTLVALLLYMQQWESLHLYHSALCLLNWVWIANDDDMAYWQCFFKTERFEGYNSNNSCKEKKYINIDLLYYHILLLMTDCMSGAPIICVSICWCFYFNIPRLDFFHIQWESCHCKKFPCLGHVTHRMIWFHINRRHKYPRPETKSQLVTAQLDIIRD
jgi:hypothetical protein